MKNKVSFFAILMMALALPQSVLAYDFSVLAPTGQTLYFNIKNDNNVEVTSQNASYPYYSTYPTGNLTIPSIVTYNNTTYTVSSIGLYAFFECENLISVIIPNSVISIGSNAFTYCVGLNSVTIPNSVALIGDHAFEECSNLISVALPNSITSIGKYAFSQCSSLTSITIPNSVNAIGIYAFWNCESLNSVTIPSSLTYISSWTFCGCSSITSIIIPSNINGLGEGVFSECSSLASIIVESGNTHLDSRNNCNAIIATSTNCLLVGCKNTIIPNSVTSIGGDAFYGCTGLTSITIPNSVNTIGLSAFGNCSNLTSITIPNSVSNIYYNPFNGCIGLTSIIVGAGNPRYDSRNNCNAIIETSTNSLISGCKNTTIPNSVTSINSSAFYGYSNINSMTIPNSITSIGSQAFGVCYNLNLNIPGSVTSIVNDAFYAVRHIEYHGSATGAPWGAISLNGVTDGDFVYSDNNKDTLIAYIGLGGDVVIPNSVSSIGQRSFFVCSELNRLTIGNNVVSIGEQAFESCSGLTAITSYATIPPTLNVFCFSNINTQIPVYVPCESLTAYQSAYGWNSFINIQCINEECDPITEFPWNATFDENLTCWKTVDADGDGYNWMNYQDYVVSESYSYFDGTNQGLTPDNWLISQRIQIPSSGTYTLSWTAAGLSDDYYNEHYSVYVSTTGDSPSDFTTPLFSETLNTPNAVNRSKSLENYRGQTVRIAFRHHNTNDVFVLGVGNVTISQNTQGIDDIDENGVHVYSEGHNIHVNEADGQSVTVYAIDGRIISAVTNATGCLSIPVPASGVYMVKVGTHPARKVVVIR